MNFIPTHTLQTSRSFQRHYRWLLSVVVSLGLIGCSSQGSKAPIVMGQIVDQESGQGASQALRLAVKEYNEADPAPDRLVNVIQVSTGGSRERFGGEAVRLTKINGVMSLLGGHTLEQTLGLEQDWVPVMSPSGMRAPTMSNYTYLTGLRQEFQGKVLAEFAEDRLFHTPSPQDVGRLVAAMSLPVGPIPTLNAMWPQQEKSVRILVLLDTRRAEFGAVTDGFTQEYRTRITKSPGRISEVDVWKYDNDLQLVEYANQLDDEHPDVLMIAGEVGAVAKVRLRYAPSDVPVLFAGLDGTQGKLLNRQETRNNIFWATAWVIDAETDTNHDFVKQYREAFQQDPDVFAALEYDNTRLLLEAFRVAKKHLSMSTIRRALKDLTDFPILTGKAAFADDRILTRSAYIVGLREGQIRTLSKHEPKSTDQKPPVKSGK